MNAMPQTLHSRRLVPLPAGVLLALAAWTALAWLAVRVQPLEWPAEPATTVTFAGQHYRVGPAEIRWLESFSELHFGAGAEEARRIVSAEIATRLEPAFAHARAQVPVFADWYYSLRGEYSRLAMAALSAVELAEPNYVANRAQAMLFPEELWERDLASLQRLAEERLAAHHERVRTGWLAAVTERLAPHRVPAPLPAAGLEDRTIALDRLHDGLAARERTAFRTRVSLSTLAAAGAAAAPALLRAAAARGAASGGRAAAARAAGRGAARVGGAAAGGAAVCAPSGPAAIACALVAGTAVWLGTDWALLRLDEHLNRDELTAALESTLTDLRAQIERALRDAYDELIAAHERAVQAEIRDDFVPAAAGR